MSNAQALLQSAWLGDAVSLKKSLEVREKSVCALSAHFLASLEKNISDVIFLIYIFSSYSIETT